MGDQISASSNMQHPSYLDRKFPATKRITHQTQDSQLIKETKPTNIKLIQT